MSVFISEPSEPPFILFVSPWVFNILITWVLLLWSSPIGPEAPFPPSIPPKATPVLPPSSMSPAAGRQSQDHLPSQEIRNFDRQRFLLAFRRQSPLQLLPCLKREVGLKGSFMFVAELEKDGFLRRVRTTESRLPACATEAIHDMNFKSLTEHWHIESVTVQWRVDW